MKQRNIRNLAFSYGLNVIETSPAYLNGQYETFIGDIVNENKIEREVLIVFAFSLINLTFWKANCDSQ